MTLKDIKHSIAVPYSFRFFRESYMFMQMILRACDSQSSTLKVNSQVRIHTGFHRFTKISQSFHKEINFS